MRGVLVLLPPSETKAPGGSGPPLAFEALSLPELNPVRRKIADALVELADDVPTSLTALGLSERQTSKVQRNAELYSAPTMPALQRYTGVLYDARRTSRTCSAAHVTRGSDSWRTRARKARRSTFGRHSTCSVSNGSTTGCGRSRKPRCCDGWPTTGCR